VKKNVLIEIHSPDSLLGTSSLPRNWIAPVDMVCYIKQAYRHQGIQLLKHLWPEQLWVWYDHRFQVRRCISELAAFLGFSCCLGFTENGETNRKIQLAPVGRKQLIDERGWRRRIVQAKCRTTNRQIVVCRSTSWNTQLVDPVMDWLLQQTTTPSSTPIS
jgi:hypothetical protein